MSAETRFIKLLARRLHEYGTPAHRLESAVSASAKRLGFDCQVFSTPTSVFLDFIDPEDESIDLPPTQLLRLAPGDIELGKLVEVDEIAENVISGNMTAEQGYQELKSLASKAAPMPAWVNILAWALTGACLALLLGSNFLDAIIAFCLGGSTGILTKFLGKSWQEAGSFEAITSFLITMTAGILVYFIGQGQLGNILIGALIILMPGLNLATAITEISTNHLSSGTARFAGAVVTLIKLALGVVIAQQLLLALGWILPASESNVIQVGSWITWSTLLALGFAFAVLFEARIKDYPIVFAACTISFVINRYASQALGPEIGVFMAAFCTAGVSNLYGRILNRPASVMRVPGLILLVPGSLGYRALTFMFSHDVDQGLSAAISVIILLAALVGGLLLGNTLVQPRRDL